MNTLYARRPLLLYIIALLALGGCLRGAANVSKVGDIRVGAPWSGVRSSSKTLRSAEVLWCRIEGDEDIYGKKENCADAHVVSASIRLRGVWYDLTIENGRIGRIHRLAQTIDL